MFLGGKMKKFTRFSIFTIFLLICLIFTSCKSTQTSSKTKNLVMDSSVKQGILENGMKYYVRKNSEPKNRIVLRLVVRAGSNMEDDDQKGVAHFIEHLAFNGTEHFEKSEIVDYFEKIGMNFGADLNAYTSFDETVYKLEIPADNIEYLKTALLILHDWANSVSFNQTEIDKERGVVTEEWRLRQGIQGRTTDSLVPFLLKDSQYENRLPIGSMDVIKNISRERILDFYKTWYRPEFMSIIAVGDIDEKTLENEIILAMSEIPTSNEKINHPNFEVPIQNKKQIKIFTDSEQKYEVINIFNRNEDYKPITTENDFYENLVLNLGEQIFYERLKEISATSDSPWLEAFIDDLLYTKNSDFTYLGIVPKEGNFEVALKAFFDECDRILDFGVTKSEISRAKTSVLVNVEQNYKNREKIQSSSYVDSLVSFDLTGKILLSADDSYRIYKSSLEKITSDEINIALKNALDERGDLLFLQMPSSTKDVPSESQIMKIWTDYKNENKLSAYEDNVDDDILMEKPKSKGKIASKNQIDELGVTKYVLNNGIQIFTKKTDFVENQIQFYAVSKGGLYLVSEDEVASGKYAVNYMFLSGLNGLSYNQFMKKISTKNISFDIDIENSDEYISGTSTNEDLETLMQVVYLMFEKPQFTDEGWNILMNELNETAKKHGTQPQEVFIDKIKEILYGKNDVFSASLDEDFIKKMDKNLAEKVYKERFENPADFSFIFVGDFDEENLLNLLEIYLGSMKTSKKRENFGEKIYSFPKNTINQTVYKGLDKQGQVFICFGGELPTENNIEQYYYERFMTSEFASLLNIRLRESIREEKGGSYGVGAFGGISGHSNRSYLFEINFGCKPEREDELKDEVLSQLKNLQQNQVSDDYIEKLQETLKREREINLRNNNWWITRITNELVYEIEPLWVSSDIEKIVNWISPEIMMEQAKKYLNTENYICVFLKPEN